VPPVEKSYFLYGLTVKLGAQRKNKEDSYSRVPRLSYNRYSAKGTKGKWRYASGYVGGRQISALWALEWSWQTFFFGQSIGIDETNSFQLKFFI